LIILFDSRLKISLEKKSRPIQAESYDFILNPATACKNDNKKSIPEEHVDFLISHFVTGTINW